METHEGRGPRAHENRFNSLSGSADISDWSRGSRGKKQSRVWVGDGNQRKRERYVNCCLANAPSVLNSYSVHVYAPYNFTCPSRVSFGPIPSKPRAAPQNVMTCNAKEYDCTINVTKSSKAALTVCGHQQQETSTLPNIPYGPCSSKSIHGNSPGLSWSLSYTAPISHSPLRVTISL